MTGPRKYDETECFWQLDQYKRDTNVLVCHVHNHVKEFLVAR